MELSTYLHCIYKCSIIFKITIEYSAFNLLPSLRRFLKKNILQAYASHRYNNYADKLLTKIGTFHIRCRNK